MLNKKELLRTEEYLLATLQSQLYAQLDDYLIDNKRSELAEKLGVSKGYISQILNGNVNFSLAKLAQLSLAMNLLPTLDFKNLDEYILENTATPNVAIVRKLKNLNVSGENTNAEFEVSESNFNIKKLEQIPA